MIACRAQIGSAFIKVSSKTDANHIQKPDFGTLRSGANIILEATLSPTIRKDEMAKSRRGRRRRRAMIEGLLITGASVFVVAVIVVLMTRSMVYHGSGNKFTPGRTLFAPRAIR